MESRLKMVLEKANENYTNASEAATKIVTKNPLPTSPEKLLTVLIQVQVTTGCLLGEVLSLLDSQKGGDDVDD